MTHIIVSWRLVKNNAFFVQSLVASVREAAISGIVDTVRNQNCEVSLQLFVQIVDSVAEASVCDLQQV
jgi:hypothetical protein